MFGCVNSHVEPLRYRSDPRSPIIDGVMEHSSRHAGRHLVLIDNYDSFTWNLVQLFYEFQLRVSVVRNDQLSVPDLAAMDPHILCVSPGPGNPGRAGICGEVVRQLGSRIPLFGVCLGMQVVNEVFGGRTVKAPTPVHGKTSLVSHRGGPLFEGIPSPFTAARYHSLQVQIASDDLRPLAFSDDGVVMAVSHRRQPIVGVQFHPESFMTPEGSRLVANLLAQWLDTP